MEQEKLEDLLRSLHETTGSNVILLAPERGEIMTYPDAPTEVYRQLQDLRSHPGCKESRLTEATLVEQSEDRPLRQKITEFITKNLSEDLSVQALCRRFAVSKSALYRLLRHQAPEGIAAYVRQLRFQKACRLLRCTELSMWQIAAEVGYDNPDYFLRAFKKEAGLSAGKYRKQVREAQCD